MLQQLIKFYFFNYFTSLLLLLRRFNLQFFPWNYVIYQFLHFKFKNKRNISSAKSISFDLFSTNKSHIKLNPRTIFVPLIHLKNVENNQEADKQIPFSF